ncbi:MAG: DUF4347 domain-containing protein, partial [Rubrivivax sp.]
MNRIYRTVWNEITRTVVAVAENVTGRGKARAGSKSRRRRANPDTDKGGSGVSPAEGPSLRRPLRLAAPRPMALEQRFMFDGAAVVETALVLAEAEQAAAILESSTDQVSPRGTTDRSATAEPAGLPATGGPAALAAEPSEAVAPPSTRSLAFVDASLPDASAIAAGFGPDTQVVLLAPGADPWRQMTEALASQSGIEAVHLVSHGDAQALNIGGHAYGQTQLALRADLLQSWREHLTADADLLLYGCDLGAEGPDSPVLRLLAEHTGADVAASADATAPASLGGNTTLEVSTGPVETKPSALDALTVSLNGTNILYGTGQGVNPTNGVTIDPYWDVVALPSIVTGTKPSVPYDAYNPLPSGLPQSGQNIFYSPTGYTLDGVTNYWMAPNSDASSLVTATSTLSANYNWIAAQDFNITQAGLYTFDFKGTADNAISFYIDGSVTGTNTQNPTIVGGTKIGGTFNNFRQLWTFNGSAYLTAGTHTAYMVLNDYGSRTAALITQSTFAPGVSTVGDVTVNEASPYAVFNVAQSAAQ